MGMDSMKHLPAGSIISVALMALSLFSTTSCGVFFIGGTIVPATVQGTISTVQLTTVANGTGGTVEVTMVTFLQVGTSTTIAFCDDQTHQFTLNQLVTVNFHPQQPCATLVAVLLIIP
jgi:hypothetical protein